MLFNIYNSCCLWALSRDMIEVIRFLNLEPVLGNLGNARECPSIFDAIERFCFHD